MDRDNNEQDIQAQSKAIQLEQHRLEKEQANLISLTPAPQHTPQGEPSNNTNVTQKQITQEINTKNTKDNEPQLVNILRTKTQNSVTSSTTLQEYCTPPLSPNSDLSDINTEKLEQFKELL